MSLDSEEMFRYARNMSLSEIGEAGQERLKKARVLIVGAGGLGCPAALYLAAAGVGTLGLIDADTVDVSNLQRQILYRTSDGGKSKVEMAALSLRALNPHIKVQAFSFALSVVNAMEVIREFDIVLDATDNFSTRYLVNDACFFLGKPNVFASVTRFEGRLSIFCSDAPCYRCLFPEPPEELILNCAAEGILGAVPGVLGTLQALETLKLILDLGNSLKGALALFDFLSMGFRTVSIGRHSDCALCGKNATIKSLQSTDLQCLFAPEISASELRVLLSQKKAGHLVDVREPQEFEKGTIPGARSIPLDLILKEQFCLSKDEPLILFCKSGMRSQTAARALIKKGFTSLSSLSGGILSWQRSLE